ncbi:MAG TPA: alpha-galactosidase [Vicinamibacterales bacterium]|nr:alpha-galactosidase [Vicinamibacterales bacterium]
MGRSPLPALVALAALALVPVAGRIHGDEPLIQIDTAFVQADGDRAWTIGNPAIRYSIASGNSGIVATGIVDPTSGQDWHQRDAADGFVTVGGVRYDLGSNAMQFVEATTGEWWGGVRLNLRYLLAAQQLEITRTYAVYPASAVIETWTTYHASGTRAVTLSDLNDYTLTVPNATARWITGTSAPDESGGAFTRVGQDLDDNQVLEIGSDTRASEQQVPWFGLGADDTPVFFGAMLWSGSWRLRLQRHGDSVDVRLGLPNFATTLSGGSSLETPHAVFGFTTEAMPVVSMALRGFIDHALRHGRPYGAYVSYNTWYSYYTALDEGSLLAEMDMAASLGVEQFVVDAGWWPSMDGDPSVDFVHGWGTYQVDMDRFPDGLSALSDHAHQLGMRFGLWVEPERVDRNTIGQPGSAAERMLAMRDGRYDPLVPNSQALSAQICFADPQARDWIIGRLSDLIDTVHPDYLKWDNNFWINCNRSGHAHGTGDGNFLHMRGVDMVRDELRSRYPDMQIEDCSSGGNRLSLDMLAYSDVSWMSDRTAPAGRVRHDLEGLIDIFPAPYLLSFAVTTDTEPMNNDDPVFDLRTLMRSRMPGAIGLSMVTREMSGGTLAGLAGQIALYKYIRPILVSGNAMRLTPQQIDHPDAPWSGWDVVEHVSPATGDAVLMAFDTADAPLSTLVKPRGLRADVLYQVESADYGDLGSVRGADLMARGVEIQASDVSRSHVVILHAQPPSVERR